MRCAHRGCEDLPMFACIEDAPRLLKLCACHADAHKAAGHDVRRLASAPDRQISVERVEVQP